MLKLDKSFPETTVENDWGHTENHADCATVNDLL